MYIEYKRVGFVKYVRSVPYGPWRVCDPDGEFMVYDHPPIPFNEIKG